MTCQEPDMNSPEFAGGAIPKEISSGLEELWRRVGNGEAHHINSEELAKALPKLLDLCNYFAWREAA